MLKLHHIFDSRYVKDIIFKRMPSKTLPTIVTISNQLSNWQWNPWKRRNGKMVLLDTWICVIYTNKYVFVLYYFSCWRFLSHSCPVSIFCQVGSSTQPLQYFPHANNQASSRLRGFAIGSPLSEPKKIHKEVIAIGVKLSGGQGSSPNHPKIKKSLHSITLTYRNIRRSR